MNARALAFAIDVASLWLIAGCGPLPGKPTAADVPIAPQQVKDFGTLYAENCSACHGENGRGNGSLALANPVYLALVSDDTMRQVATQGIPGTLMPAFAQSAGGMLTDEQIDIIVRGIRSHWAKPDEWRGATLPPYTDSSPGDVQRGRAVFTTFCASCHGPEGKGTEKSGSIVNASYLALVSDQNLRTTVIAGRPELNHPDWRNDVANRALTAQEVTDVVAWLASHRLLTPGQPYPTSQTKP